nr:MAG TPA: hypothetical protein [Caudoviricetes sp.]
MPFKCERHLFLMLYTLLYKYIYSPRSCLSIFAAARRPSPIARITVAPPRVMSPPAYNPL